MANSANTQQTSNTCDAGVGREPSRLVNDGEADGRSQGANHV
ncbi:hypothetical protein SynBIOSU31_02772 [Synechococcus sp. BIOS-U3-1]|nr:hypothetical protein SynBIOSU31_02772 [Synechococcus sp. BIOS-U3-1]